LSAIETVLIYAGIPAAVVAVIYGAVFAGSAQRGRRYRPGRPFGYRPVWFLSAPATISGTPVRSSAAALSGAAPESGPAALSARGGAGAGEWPVEDSALHGTTGGASDTW